MKLNELLLTQLEREATNSRLALARVPEGHNDWKPHAKSMPLGYLAALVATMPSWILSMVKQDEFDMASPEAAKFKPLEWHKREELAAALEASVGAARGALQNTNDENLMKTWKFMVGGNIVSESPRYVAIIESVFSHLAHHRGQLTVYLRLNEATVPAMYGPSADEGKFVPRESSEIYTAKTA